MKEKRDPYTGEMFIPSRSDQRFACRENRIRFHNQCASELRQQKRFVDRPLQRNFKILTELLKGKKTAKFHKQFLLGKGFNFSVSTHLEEIDGISHFAVYHYTIIADQNSHYIKIIKNG